LWPVIEQALLSSPRLTFDLSKTTYIDARGVGLSSFARIAGSGNSRRHLCCGHLDRECMPCSVSPESTRWPGSRTPEHRPTQTRPR
jgi:hypothetical protein